jgi:hypothetical protein
VSGQHLPPDHSLGDASTIGGYAAVHARPAGFEGADGASYSVEVMTDETGDRAAPWAAYLFFIRWSPGRPGLEGHLESEYLERGATEAEVRAALGAWPLDAGKHTLDALIRRRSGEAQRPGTPGTRA